MCGSPARNRKRGSIPRSPKTIAILLGCRAPETHYGDLALMNELPNGARCTSGIHAGLFHGEQPSLRRLLAGLALDGRHVGDDLLPADGDDAIQ